MVNGPPCGVCGFTLRWIAQHSSWGCDRCQRMFPASAPPQPGPSPWAPPQQQSAAQHHAQPQPYAPPPSPYGAPPPQQRAAPQYGGPSPAQPAYAPPGAPQLGYAPQPSYASQPVIATAPPATSSGGKKSKGLMIGLIAAVLVGGGGAAAFVMLRGGGGGGTGSRTDVVNNTLAALSAGDGDKLVKLADPVGVFEQVVDCTDKTPRRKSDDHGDDPEDPAKPIELSEQDKEDRDPQKQLEKRRTALAEVAQQLKGTKLELVEILTKEPPTPSDDEGSDDEKGMLMKRGQRILKGCVAKVPVRIHMAKLKLKVGVGDEPPGEQEVTMSLVQVGSRWYLADPPRVKLGTAALEKEVAAIRDQVCACKDVACAQQLKDEFKGSPRSKQLKEEVKALSDDDRAKVMAIEGELKACERKLEAAADDDQNAVTLAKMTEFRDRACACTDEPCGTQVGTDLATWAQAAPDDQVTKETLAQVTKLAEEATRCIVKVSTPAEGERGGIGSTIAAVAETESDFAPWPDMPEQCEPYRQLMARMANCANYGADNRKAIVDAWKQMSDSMTGVPAAARKAANKSIGETCQQAIKPMEQGLQGLRC